VKRRSMIPVMIMWVIAIAAHATILAQDSRSASSPADYVLGVEDRLSISVWKEPDFSRTVAIRPDGKITCPLVGDIQAAGRTAKQLAADLTTALSRFIKEPVVTVSVEEIESFKVFVLGEVTTQGALVLRRRTRLLEAIALSGGMTQFANRADVVLIRYDDDKEIRTRIDYRKIVSGEKSELNVFLRPGDTIIVN
jgi:polysaccharide export outer membrane protein